MTLKVPPWRDFFYDAAMTILWLTLKTLGSLFVVACALRAVCWKRVNEILGTDFATVEDLVNQQRAEHEANLPTAEQRAENKKRAQQVMAEDRKRRRAELNEYKKRNICPRCHGKGGSDAWYHTGWTCNRCFGSGKYA